jgi:hypothetical protein
MGDESNIDIIRELYAQQNGAPVDAIIYDEWAEAFYTDKHIEPNNVVFHSGPGKDNEMLRVSPDGFYVRGVKVSTDAKEAEQVYTAFKQWLTWNTLATK